jgi:hypothetical protein
MVSYNRLLGKESTGMKIEGNNIENALQPQEESRTHIRESS